VSEIELLECPFCGGKGSREKRERGFIVECDRRWHDCPMNLRTRHYQTRAEADAAWNTRAATKHKESGE
jgi:hypothetical protein